MNHEAAPDSNFVSLPISLRLPVDFHSKKTANPLSHPTPPYVEPDCIDNLGLIDESEILPVNCSFKLAVQLRGYQKELAGPGVNGENYILIMPTGSGKTYVAAAVISDHLQKNCSHQEMSSHVVFVVSTKPLAAQQKERISCFIPDAKVEVYTGENVRMVADSIKQENNVSICTAGKLLEEIRKGQVNFDQISLMILDECHHAQKSHPYAQLMELYLEYEEERPLSKLPQVIGMTASPGAGENRDMDKRKTINHLMKLAALLNATGSFKVVSDLENMKELQRYSKNSSSTRKILRPRDKSDPLIECIVAEMERLEEPFPSLKNGYKKWSQEYEASVQVLKLRFESSKDKAVRDDIGTLNLLRCYCRALQVYFDLQLQDCIKEIEDYANTGFPKDYTKATSTEVQQKYMIDSLLHDLKQMPPRGNPLVENFVETVSKIFEENPTSRALVFISRKKYASSIYSLLCHHPAVQGLVKPAIITGSHDRETGPGMTHKEQQRVMARFRTGESNLVVSTSVLEEGLDVAECNLVVRYQYVTSDIGQLQAHGRARAEDSQVITIFSSDSRKAFQEHRNTELNLLVNEIFAEKCFPTGLDFEQELKKIQQKTISERRAEAALKERQRQAHDSNSVKLFCKTCKEFACYGSDIYCEETHHLVPDVEFEKKITWKEHPRKDDLILGRVMKTHKIHCIKCDRDWGVGCIWRAGEYRYPVVKVSAFTFEIGGIMRPLKKWGDAPFDCKPLSVWRTENL